MSPTSRRLRLSIDNEFHDAAQLYARAHHHNNSTTYDKVFFDSQGRPHDPEFVSHIFPTTTAADRRRAKKARRLSQTGLIQDSDTDEEEISEEEYNNMATDPFRSYTANTRRAAQSAYYPSASTSYSPTGVAKNSLYPATPAAYRQYDQQRRNRFSYPTPTSSASSSPPSWQYTASLLNESDNSPVSEKWNPRRWTSRSASASSSEDKERRVLKKRRMTLAELVEDEDDEDHQQERQAGDEDPEECAPTCWEAFRRECQSLNMRISLFLFRNKRRITSHHKRRKERKALEAAAAANNEKFLVR